MNISGWLDKKEAEGFDVSQIELPNDLSYDEGPDETIYFEEIRPCGIVCRGNHPFSTVERFGHWFYIVEVKTKKPVFTHRKWNGNCLPKTGRSHSKQLNHT